MVGFRYAQVPFRTDFTIFQLYDIHANSRKLLISSVELTGVFIEIRPVPTLNLKNWN